MIRVLVVDDSVVFRTQITGAIGRNVDIEVVGTAATGAIALQKLAQLTVDVVTLDFEMPDMNGIEVLREIKKRGFPVHVIVFSSQTQRGAEAALDALREGADDVVAKPSGEGLTFETAGKAIEEALVPKILQFNSKASIPITEAPKIAAKIAKRDLARFLPEAIVIGSSTGGPTALEKIFASLTGPITVPIFIAQHMPPVFTEILARRLGEISGIPSEEAKAGTIVEANHIYVAPGDYHLLLEASGKGTKIALNQMPQRNSVRPAVDYLFESAAQVYKQNCLGVVLTGMGEDGLAGAKALRALNAPIIIQDRESCVVFGMPGAIFAADDYDQMGDLNFITSLLKRLVKTKG